MKKPGIAPAPFFHARRREAGLSLLELVIVLGSLGAIAIGILGIVQQYGRGQRDHEIKAAETIVTELKKARLNARLGVDQAEARTVVLTTLRLPKTVELVTEVGAGELPAGVTLFNPHQAVVFDPQSGLLSGDGGMIVVQDRVTKRARGIVIPRVYGPLQRYVKYPGDQHFTLMSSVVY
ncbi:MAG: hypothetical protein HY774_11420 [Acidobacteria bacterium]|nr:hypothetical protein [Acidobacteriota bacterium]